MYVQGYLGKADFKLKFLRFGNYTCKLIECFIHQGKYKFKKREKINMHMMWEAFECLWYSLNFLENKFTSVIKIDTSHLKFIGTLHCLLCQKWDLLTLWGWVIKFISRKVDDTSLEMFKDMFAMLILFKFLQKQLECPNHFLPT